jgi:co-chaperonin GroES (HSP10)
MKTVGYNVLIELEKETEDTINVGGQELFFNGEYNPLYTARRYGNIVGTNPRLEAVGLKEGRKVHFHHFVPLEANESHWHVSHKIEAVSSEDSKVYEASAHPKATQIYAYEDESGEVHTLYDYLFVEPIINEIPQTESGIFLDYEEKEEIETGIIRYLNEKGEELGLKVGDTVRFAENCEYDMEIKGETLYRMTLEDIYFVYGE